MNKEEEAIIIRLFKFDFMTVVFNARCVKKYSGRKVFSRKKNELFTHIETF